MVRHEAAEALGGIATPEVLPYLKEYMTREDAPVVVRESCQVALDMYEVGVSSSSGKSSCAELRIYRSQYENSDQFQYANGLDGTR
jgi:deoxyhypusine monooxygenase